MSLLMILGLVLLAILSLPRWPWSKTWGYFPLGFFVGMLTMMLLLALSRAGATA